MKRYKITINGFESGHELNARYIKESGDGEWVKYTDFAAEVNRIVRKRMAENRGTVHPAITRAVERRVEDETEKRVITLYDVRVMIEALADDVEGYNSPVYDSNPHAIAMRTALGAVIYALKQGIQ